MSDISVGDEVRIPWGVDEVGGRVVDIYGEAPRVHVVVELTPELSEQVVAEPTTVVYPLDAVRRAGAAA